MATELTNIARAISTLVVPSPPIIESAIAFITAFIPAFQLVLVNLAPGSRIYFYFFFPPSTWTAATIATNKTACQIPDPGAYPTLAGSGDAATYLIDETRYKRNSSKHADSLCAMHIITQYLLTAIPPHLIPIIFPNDLSYAINNTPTQIFTAINAHFIKPTDLDFQNLQAKLITPFIYIDATSLEKFLSTFSITVSTLALIQAPISASEQVSKLKQAIRASPDADTFSFLLQSYEMTHSTVASDSLSRSHPLFRSFKLPEPYSLPNIPAHRQPTPGPTTPLMRQQRLLQQIQQRNQYAITVGHMATQNSVPGIRQQPVQIQNLDTSQSAPGTIGTNSPDRIQLESGSQAHGPETRSLRVRGY
jgi:hypothetical protein